tara:strand:- start:14187 stop:15290 length:1104 start_codon:yes stop_codon:yes gene_type:complete
MQPFKVIISGGGTGGHIFPAIAIANALKEKVAGVEILFVGAKGKMEMEKIPNAGYSIEGLWINGLQRSLKDTRNLLFPFKLLSSLWKSFWIIKKYKPNVVVGTGGYASGPLLFMGSKLGVPALIQEQNSYPGITNKLLAKTVQCICVAYKNMERFFPKKKLLFLGNPVRQDILEIKNKRTEAIQYFDLDAQNKTVLVVGGSLGAKTINESMTSCLDMLSNENTQLIWQTGENYAEEAAKEAEGKFHVKVMPFIAKMDLAYAAADIIVSRAGASTISELCLIGKPAILVPSPNVAEDHQTKNAMALYNEKAALMVSDKSAKEDLPLVLKNLLGDTVLQQDLREKITKLAKHQSAEKIADEVIKLVKRT